MVMQSANGNVPVNINARRLFEQRVLLVLTFFSSGKGQIKSIHRRRIGDYYFVSGAKLHNHFACKYCTKPW